MHPSMPVTRFSTFPGFCRTETAPMTSAGVGSCPATRAMGLVAAGRDLMTAVRQAEAAFDDPQCRADMRCVWRAAVALACANATRSWDARLAALVAEGRGVELAALMRARTEFFLGNPHSSRETLSALAGSAGTETMRDIAVAWLVEVLVELGEVGEAGAVLARHRVDRLVGQQRPTKSMLLAARAAVRVATGADGGIADYLACGREMAASGITNPAVLSWQGKAALAAKGTEMAVRLAAQELAAARSWGAPRALGRALYASALVHDDASSVDKLQEAADLLDLALTRTDLVHVLLALGVRLAGRNELAPARAKLNRALQLAQQTGNDYRVEQVRSAIRQLSHREQPGPILNEHEMRVAELARGGDTTKQIAGKLFLTPRGVEFHLTSIYRKLGISSRRELASALPETPATA